MNRASRLALAILLTLAALAIGTGVFALHHVPQWRLDVEAAMDAIGLKPGMVVGEAGAGSGYFTLPMAKRVGRSGMVYANDIDRRALASLEVHARDAALSNVRTVVGEVDDPFFPRRDLELIVVVHAFHDFDRPVEWLVNAKKYLRPGAAVAIIDRDPEKGAESHFWSQDRITGYASKAGYTLLKAADGASEHLILLFRADARPIACAGAQGRFTSRRHPWSGEPGSTRERAWRRASGRGCSTP
jgi:ubiquinone/menaquinone biosynthesis C-methylase UbiE